MTCQTPKDIKPDKKDDCKDGKKTLYNKIKLIIHIVLMIIKKIQVVISMAFF